MNHFTKPVILLDIDISFILLPSLVDEVCFTDFNEKLRKETH
ncbi:hypothetical protein ETAE_1304 [Edwardsiella piscicida]|uniref:Uncharacterized protein n=1 Tax=Edwardsiella piscicida TaxID=1263550 RepID=A0AAU8PJN5_EDWPI|nr:hypothetical protein ETAE_1304 [Edwardsiella tarda EIB202]